MGSPSGSEPCRLLEWDSQFWGFRCAAVASTELRDDSQAAVDSWCRQARVTFLQYLAPAGDLQSGAVAVKNGFRLVDERLTLGKSVHAGDHRIQPGSFQLRPAQNGDIAELEAIARISHTASRYYEDPEFPRAGCDLLYATWIRRSVQGFLADAVLVTAADGHAVGYITCKRESKHANRGWIDLVGVSPAAQGRGLGTALVNGAVEWFLECGLEEVLVVTQGRNTRAQKLYKSCGFLPRHSQSWFHKWYRGAPRGIST